MLANQILKTSTNDLCDYFVAKYTVEVPVLLEDKILADQSEAEIDVRSPLGKVSQPR